MVKVTFTLDEPTVFRLRDAAQRLAKPQSQVVREAIDEYHGRMGKLSEAERVRRLKLFDELVSKIPARPLAEVKRELREIRRARRAGWR